VLLHRLPVRVRLVVGFSAAMVVVLAAAGAFVFWRVEVALDNGLDQDLTARTRDLRQAALQLPPVAALRSLRDEGRESQLLSADGAVLASGAAIPEGRALLGPGEARRAGKGGLTMRRGNLFLKGGEHLRILAVPVHGVEGTAVAAAAVRLDHRDEALRELLAALAIANLIALAVASFVGYRFAHAALDPVERYRAQADEIAAGATGVRLDVPDGPEDEITRLGATLNHMVEALEHSAERQQQFIDDASHELRTPLSALSAEIEVALRKPRTTQEYEATLLRLGADTTKLLSLAETLLTLGALGSSTPNAADVPATPLVEDAGGRARTQLEGSGRAVTVDVASEVVLRGDEHLLSRALGNVVDNAVRHGRGDIGISVHLAGCRVALITVHDEGAINRDFLGHAAERFRQDESSRAGSGAGLGLALVDAIASAHGGQIRICSAGSHHSRPSPDPDLARIPCSHRDDGTTISLLFATSPIPSDARVRR
jgi:two-component system OmpR family sensor kinase